MLQNFRNKRNMSKCQARSTAQGEARSTHSRSYLRGHASSLWLNSSRRETTTWQQEAVDRKSFKYRFRAAKACFVGTF